jgi:hypothetical protein
MKKKVIENFDEWIFEALAPKETAIPAGYSKSTVTGTEQLTVEEIKKASGWKALKNEDYLQVSDLKNEGTGVASNKVEDFKGKGELVMSPVIYGNKNGVSFVVGFPFSKPSLEGETAKDIYKTDKYLLFTPFDGDKPNLVSNPAIASTLDKPTNFRLIDKDKPLLVGLQSLMWVLGFNNAEKAKQMLSTLTKEDIIKQLKSGMTTLSEVNKISTANDAAGILSEGYKAILSDTKSAVIIFNNFAASHAPAGGKSKITTEDIQKELGLKTV